MPPASSRKPNHPLVDVLLAQLLYWALLYATVAFIAVVYPEEVTANYSSAKGIEAGAVLAITSLLGSQAGGGRARVSQIVVHLINAFLIIPIFAYYAACDEPRDFFYAVAFAFALLAVLVRTMRSVHVPRANRQLLRFATLLGGMASLYVYGALIATGALGRLNLSLWNVYEARAALLEGGTFPLAGYLLPWQGYVVNPALLAFGVRVRSSPLIMAAAGAQLLLFAMANFKSFLFAPLLVVALVFIGERRSAARYLYLGAAAAIGLGYAVYAATGDHMTPSIAIRRMFLVPAKNHFLYYNWFSEHPKVMLSNSIFSLFFEYPYDVPVTRVISWAYYGRDFGPNVGYLGDAYAHFGVPGMIAFTGVLAVILRLLDSLAKDVPLGVATAVTAIPVMALMNSGLFTTLLTHGLGVSMIAVWCMSGIFAAMRQSHFGAPQPLADTTQRMSRAVNV